MANWRTLTFALLMALSALVQPSQRLTQPLANPACKGALQ